MTRLTLGPAIVLTCAALALVFGGTYYLAAGGGALSRSEATELVIATYGDTTTAGPAETTITVDAISQTSSTEAIAHTQIGDEPALNLKFRRWDTGWRLEFAETKTGGWLDVHEVFTQMHEQEAALQATFERVGPNQYRPRR